MFCLIQIKKFLIQKNAPKHTLRKQFCQINRNILLVFMHITRGSISPATN